VGTFKGIDLAKPRIDHPKNGFYQNQILEIIII